MKYDYIIAGAGCAGLSLLYHILKDEQLKSSRILVLDRTEKTDNDRTWCYWEKGEGVFEDIVHHEWSKLEFHAPEFTRAFEMKDYSYKMIQGIDFYKYVMELVEAFDNVDFKYEDIIQIGVENDVAIVKTSQGEYQGGYVFNSTTLFNPKMDKENSLLQHFQGWVIKTEEATFDSSVGTLMDFRLDQEHGDTFMYVLPTSEHEALVEYTLFSPEILDKKLYAEALQDYIHKYLGIKNFQIIHEEYGVIPMSLAHFEKNVDNQRRIVNIGTAGGHTKASSGYTFQFIQKNCSSILLDLKKDTFPLQKLSFRDKMFAWYDRTLLDVIINDKMRGSDIFAIMFKKLSPERILAFLGNESKFIEDIKIMNSVPLWPFISSGIKQLFSR
jgi:lycopene beta-cyclase